MLDMGENQDLFVRDGYTYKPFGSKSKPAFAVFVEGSDEMAARYCGILAVALSGIKQYYDEKYDRNNFIKNVILDNILPDDIYVKAPGNALQFGCEPGGSAGADRLLQ